MDRLTDAERSLILEALYCLHLRRAEHQPDPKSVDDVLAIVAASDTIRSTVFKLGGDPDAALFGAFGE